MLAALLKELIFVLPSSDPLRVPSLTVDRVTNSTVEYQVQRNNGIAGPLNSGYEVIRFGVPMRVRHVITRTEGRVTISPVVPGSQYKITAWALRSSTSRSATPAVVYATAGETSECDIRTCIIPIVYTCTWDSLQLIIIYHNLY